MGLSAVDKEVCKDLVNRKKRSEDFAVILVCHSLYSTSMFSFLQNVDRLIVTKHAQNRRSHMAAASSLKVSPQEAESVWKSLMNSSKKFAYLVLNTHSLQYEIGEDDMFDSQKKIDKTRNKMRALLASRGNAETGMALFEHVVDNLNLSKLDSSDLSIEMRKEKSRQRVKVYLVDTIFFATTEEGIEPTESSIRLFKEMQKLFSVPTMLVRNEKFRKAVEGDEEK